MLIIIKVIIIFILKTSYNKMVIIRSYYFLYMVVTCMLMCMRYAISGFILLYPSLSQGCPCGK